MSTFNSHMDRALEQADAAAHRGAYPQAAGPGGIAADVADRPLLSGDH